MPYGDSIDAGQSYTENTYYYYPGGYYVYSTQVQGGDVVRASLSRSGSSRNGLSFGKSAVSKPPKYYEKRLVTVFSGPKLKSRVFSMKLRKWVYAREAIQVWRYVRVKPPKVKVGMDLPPNSLYFRQAIRKDTPHMSTITTSYPGDPSQGRWETDGDLMHVSARMEATNYRLASLMGSTIALSDKLGLFSQAESKASARASNKLAERVKNQSVNFAQTVAEFHQVKSMIADSATRLAKVILDLKRGNLVRAAKELFPKNTKALASDVLVYQYGVRPLLSDIDGMAKFLATPMTRFVDIVVSVRENVPSTSYTFSNQWPHSVETEVVDSGYVDVKYKFRVELILKGLQGMKELGIGNPVALAWELIPFSFVADWFIPIGDYLNSLDAYDGCKIIHGHRTVFRKKYTKVTRNYGGFNIDGWKTETKSVTNTFEETECAREILTAFPEIQLPSLKDPLSRDHVINAMALIRQLSKR